MSTAKRWQTAKTSIRAVTPNVQAEACCNYVNGGHDGSLVVTAMATCRTAETLCMSGGENVHVELHTKEKVANGMDSEAESEALFVHDLREMLERMQEDGADARAARCSCCLLHCASNQLLLVDLQSLLN